MPIIRNIKIELIPIITPTWSEQYLDIKVETGVERYETRIKLKPDHLISEFDNYFDHAKRKLFNFRV